jgi:hypothetical protein
MAAGPPVSTGTVPEPLPDGVSSSSEVSLEELQLAHRNHGMHLEGLRYDRHASRMHYLLIHFDVPEADEGSWEALDREARCVTRSNSRSPI